MNTKNIRKAMSVMAIMLAAALALVSCSESSLNERTKSNDNINTPNEDFNINDLEYLNSEVTTQFSLDSEPEYVFAASDLFVFTENTLDVYTYKGEKTSHKLDKRVTKACEAYKKNDETKMTDRFILYINDKQDLYKYELDTEKSEFLLGGVKDVSAGSYLCGAVTNDGKLYLWGADAGQYFGIGGDVTAPTQYKSEVKWKDIEFSGIKFLGLDESGCVYENEAHGNADKLEVAPVKKIDKLGDIDFICCGYCGKAAVSKSGQIYYWFGLYGSGDKIPDLDSPADAQAFFNEKKIVHFAFGGCCGIAYDEQHNTYFFGEYGESKYNKGIDNVRAPKLDKALTDYDEIYCGSYVIYLRKGKEIRAFLK